MSLTILKNFKSDINYLEQCFQKGNFSEIKNYHEISTVTLSKWLGPNSRDFFTDLDIIRHVIDHNTDLKDSRKLINKALLPDARALLKKISGISVTFEELFYTNAIAMLINGGAPSKLCDIQKYFDESKSYISVNQAVNLVKLFLNCDLDNSGYYYLLIYSATRIGGEIDINVNMVLNVIAHKNSVAILNCVTDGFNGMDIIRIWLSINKSTKQRMLDLGLSDKRFKKRKKARLCLVC